MDEIIQIKVSQLPVAASLDNLAILGVDLVTNESVQALMSLLKGLDGKSAQLQKTSTHIQWRVEGGSWANLVALADIKGDTGANIELQKTATHVQWRVTGGTWANLIPLSDLKGEKGDPFTYSDFTPTQLEGLKVKGDTGASIELQVTSTHIQWRVEGTSTWNNLVALSELKGTKGDTGHTPQFSAGTVTAVEHDASPTFTLVPDGTAGDGSPKYKINIGIPKGKDGEDGEGAGNTIISNYADGLAAKKYVLKPVSNGSLTFTLEEESGEAYDEISETEITNGTGTDKRTITGRRVAYILSKVKSILGINESTGSESKYLSEKGTFKDIPTAYTLPTASSTVKGGVKIGSNLSITGEVLSATDTTYSEATTSEAGLMSAADKTKVDAVKTAASAFTGNALPLDNVLGSFQTGTANNSATFTLGTTKIAGAWGKVLVNRSSQPTITGATLILGSEFEASTNMYMVYGYDGNRTEYYFSKITE